MNQQASTSRYVPPQNAFIRDIEREFQQTFRFEGENSHNSAKSVIPLNTLKELAFRNMREHQKALKEGSIIGTDMAYDDALLIELLNWFKTSFFKWMDEPECDFCTSKTKFLRNVKETINNAELRKEVFQCVNCEKLVNFIRYQDPLMLLKTRKGRCGEWANCFTLLCRALGYDARIVLDTTDHVWTEVYSFAQGRWIHCDPCENVLDTPLMYESGWGKKLEYIIAYSKDEVQDVSWRYSSNHKALLDRRKKCSENDLIDAIVRLRRARLENATQARAHFVTRRAVTELVELMTERKPNDKEHAGRTSGSLNWRQHRGEYRSFTPFVWKLSTADSHRLEYYSALDKYELRTGAGTIVTTKKGWHSGIFNMENVFRKEEHDWKTVYLARNERTNEAKATWKIMLDQGLTIKDITVKTSSYTCENGSVVWTICSGNTCIQIPAAEESNFRCPSLLQNHDEFTLTAHLSKGKGNEAWQHAQIFRQKMDAAIPALQINVTTSPK